MSLSTVENVLNDLNKPQLIALMGDLYKKHKAVKDYLDFYAQPDEEMALEQFSERLHRIFFPKRSAKIDLKKAKAIITEFRKLEPSAEKTAELMIVYLDYAIEASDSYWRVPESYVNSLVNVFKDTMAFLAKEGLLTGFDPKVKRVIKGTESIGWGCTFEFEYYYRENTKNKRANSP